MVNCHPRAGTSYRDQILWWLDSLNVLPRSEEEFTNSPSEDFNSDACSVPADRTQWSKWLIRIQTGEDAELFHITKAIEESDTPIDEDWFNDQQFSDIYISNKLSDSMHACIVVTLWLNIECMLKKGLERWEDYSRYIMAKRILNKVNATPTESPLDPESQVEEIMKELKSEETRFDQNSVKFDDIKAQYRKTIGIKLKDIKHFKLIDAVRILNNCFKHCNGKYDTKGSKSGYVIDAELAGSWDLKDGYAINYPELPLQDIVIDSGIYVDSLITKVKTKVTEEAGDAG